MDEIDYAVDDRRVEAFYESVRAFYPGLASGSLSASYAGIRPKLQRPGASMADFMMLGPADHGQAGLVELLGMESPGLTAALAIADEVVERLQTG